MTKKAWLNDNTSSDNVLYIKVQGNYQLAAVLLNSVPIPGFGNWDGTLTANGQTLASLQSLVADFVNEQGYPWMVIGDITGGNGAIAAVNLEKVYAMAQGTNGLTFNGSSDYTSGYDPFASYSVAHNELLDLMGRYSF